MQKRRRAGRRRAGSANKRTKSKRSGWMSALTVGGFIAYTSLAGLWGVFLADTVLLPLNIAHVSTLKTTPPTLLPYQSPSPKPIATPAKTTAPVQSPKVDVVKDVKFPRLDFFALQVGAFSDAEAAKKESVAIAQRGGAGYILYDVRFRVFTSLYLSESDARSVKDRLLKESNIDSYIYSGAVPAVELTVTASQGKIDSITSSYEAWRETVDLLRKLSDLVDSGDMQPDEAVQSLEASAENLRRRQSALNPGANVEDENGVLDGLSLLIEKTLLKTEDFCRRNFAGAMDFSATIKYNYIEAVFEYKEYISAISASFA